MNTNKLNVIIDNIQTSLTGMKIKEIDLQDIKTIKSDLQIVKDKMDELEDVVDAYILVLE